MHPLGQGSRWRCLSLAGHSQCCLGTPHAPEPLIPHQCTEQVCGPQTYPAPWAQAQEPSGGLSSPGSVQATPLMPRDKRGGLTTHPVSHPPAAPPLPSHPSLARHCINSCLCLRSASAWEIISADGT